MHYIAAKLGGIAWHKVRSGYAGTSLAHHHLEREKKKQSVLLALHWREVLYTHIDKFRVVDLAVAVDVRFSDHLLYFVVRQLLAQVCHAGEKYMERLSVSLRLHLPLRSTHT